MNKIIFARIVKSKKNKNWDWSGTVNSLYMELSKKFEIIDLYYYWDIYVILSKCLEKIKLKKYDMSILEIKRADKSIRKKQTQLTYPIIQFDEFPSINISKSYIYQDLSVLYLLDIAQKDVNTFSNSGFSHIPLSSIKQRADLQLKFYQDCNCILTMGKWLQKYLISTNLIDTKKIHHVGGGINIDKNKIDYSFKESNKILFIGKDFERKAGPLVVEAFDFLQKKINKNAELYIIGPKTISIDFHNENIHFIGELKSDQLPYYYNLCDIFCMPSYFEAYGLVFIEALTFGLPCIGRKAFEMPYFIEDGITGYLIENDSIENLANKMNDLLINKEIKSNVKSLKERYIEEYCWSTVADRIVETLK